MAVMDALVVAAVTAVAAGQHGAISVDQLRRCGMSSRRQRAAVAGGWLTQVEPRVLVVSGSGDSWHRRVQTGLLALAGAGWVSHEAAAALHRFDRAIDGAVEFTVLRSSRGRTCRSRVHTTDSVGPLDLVTVDGFRCTSATRTIIDLAHVGIARTRLEAAIDSAVRDGLTAPIVLERRLGELRGRGRWGARRLDRLLIDSGGESVLERRFLRLLRDAGLPRPETQVVQRRDGRHVGRVDFLFRDHGLVVEVSGGMGHSTPTERGRDAQRRNELQDIGLTVYEYTWTHVTERSAWVASTMRERLSRASASSGTT